MRFTLHTSSFDTRPANVGRGESPVSFLFIPPFFIRRGAMPRHMPRTAHEPRGVNKIHGLVVAVETEQLNRRFLFTILYLAAGKQRQIVVGIASLSLYFCPGNRATCPCRSDGRASTSAMSVVRLHPRATCTQYQAVFKGLSDICKCGVIGSTSDFHSDSAGSNPVICSMALWSAKQLNSAGSCSGLPVTCQ